MADKRGKQEEDEIKIPVFSVLKKGSILKNIFLNIPTPESDFLLESGEIGDRSNREDEPIIIGRHPDCHIMLDHPSISRFHLEVRAKPMSQKLSVTDRSSVHGTWVSGIKIQPHVPVELVEGDTLRLGASTRMYRLRWVPLSRAFEMENTLEPVPEEKEETHQDEISVASMSNSIEVSDAQILSAPPVLESRNPSCSDGENPETKEMGDEGTSSFCYIDQIQDSVSSSLPIVEVCKAAEDSSAVEVPSESENPRSLKPESKVMSSSLLSRRNKSVSSLLVPAGRSKERNRGVSFDADVEVETQKENNGEEEEETFDSARENFTPNISVVLNEGEEVFHSDKENWTPEVPRDLKSDATVLHKLAKNGRDEEEKIATDKENLILEISYDMKLQESQIELHTSFLNDITPPVPQEDMFHPERENSTPEVSSGSKLELPSFENCVKNGGEEAASLSVKENFTPSISIFFNKEEVVFPSDEENWAPEVPRDLKLDTLAKNGRDEEERVVPDRENLTPEISYGMKLPTSSSNDITTFFLPEDMFHAERDNWTPEVSEGLKSEIPISENCVRSSREEDASISSKRNSTPETSHDQGVQKNCIELQGSSSNAITALNVEENMYHSDRENCTPEVPRDLKSKKCISIGREEEAFSSDNMNSAREITSSRKLEKTHIELLGSPSDVITTMNFEEEVLVSYKKARTPDLPGNLKLKKHVLENRREEDTVPSDKENLTPDALGVLSSNKPWSETQARIEREIMRKRVERVPFQPLLDSNSMIYSPMMLDKGDTNSVNSKATNSNSVNHAQRTVDETKNTVPFQPLLDSNSMIYSPMMLDKGDTNSVNSKATISDSVNHAQRTVDETKNTLHQSAEHQVLPEVGGEKKKWNIVVDTNCFLNEESRRSLQLLEGLRGTHLIIPRMVIRELDYLKRHESWLRMTTTKASSALEWIEECMVKASWWIHVQSSLETMPAAASTPPASPRDLMEIVTPTAEDHILDTALLFRRIKTDGPLVLLSNSITLKIKAMAEGLICETPKEFRESLLNPYSKRFLWVGSSPRGSTWSFSDEMGLMENNYYHQYLNARKTAKVDEVAKGLKVILLTKTQ